MFNRLNKSKRQLGESYYINKFIELSLQGVIEFNSNEEVKYFMEVLKNDNS